LLFETKQIKKEKGKKKEKIQNKNVQEINEIFSNFNVLFPIFNFNFKKRNNKKKI